MATKRYDVTNTNTKTGKPTATGSSGKSEFHPKPTTVVVKQTPQPTAYQNIREGITAKNKRETNAGLRK